jgi:hypothetical protein
VDLGRQVAFELDKTREGVANGPGGLAMTFLPWGLGYGRVLVWRRAHVPFFFFFFSRTAPNTPEIRAQVSHYWKTRKFNSQS